MRKTIAQLEAEISGLRMKCINTDVNYTTLLQQNSETERENQRLKKDLDLANQRINNFIEIHVNLARALQMGARGS